jgi:hypothetical protein
MLHTLVPTQERNLLYISYFAVPRMVGKKKTLPTLHNLHTPNSQDGTDKVLIPSQYLSHNIRHPKRIGINCPSIRHTTASGHKAAVGYIEVVYLMDAAVGIC